MKRTSSFLLSAILFCLSSLSLHAQYIETHDGKAVKNVPLSEFVQDKTQLLNFGWKFQLGNHEGAEKADFDDSSWRQLDLPHDFQFEQPWDETADKGRGFKQMCEGWYRKTFKAPASLKNGQRIVLDFEGVMYICDVYVNGKKVASNEYGYTGFEADITKALNYDGENTIAVYASTCKTNASR